MTEGRGPTKRLEFNVSHRQKWHHLSLKILTFEKRQFFKKWDQCPVAALDMRRNWISVQSRKWQPTSVFLPGKSHEQRSLGEGATVHGVAKRVRHDWAAKQQQSLGAVTQNPVQLRCEQWTQDKALWLCLGFKVDLTSEFLRKRPLNLHF